MSTILKTEFEAISVILFSNNISKIMKIFNIQNINTRFEDLGGYTALHYVVSLPNKQDTIIILLNLGADPYLKINNLDVFDMATTENIKFIYLYLKKEDTKKYTILEEKINILRNKNRELNETNNIQSEFITNCNNKIRQISEKNNLLEPEITRYKRKYEEIEAKLEETEKAVLKYKRKFEETDKAFDILQKNQKK
jgi:hypothetical protein